ncbi:MAG: cell division protein FtsL [Bacilli bacterium]|nr:cell division protein FtsL [Bacilli bacterium]PWL42263.1 MAG: cell division protein FtsL [Clostridiaceae bacterium]CDA52690.1 cell division protein FtsL [Clostridium sp. CAG:533]
MKKTRKRVKLCGVDRLMIMVIALLIVFTPVLVVYSKSTLSESNIELERIKRKVEKQESINESVAMKINELASLSNIQDVAKEHGLDYNNDNIIVVK